MLRPQADEKGITLETDLPSDLPAVRGGIRDGFRPGPSQSPRRLDGPTPGRWPRPWWTHAPRTRQTGMKKGAVSFTVGCARHRQRRRARAAPLRPLRRLYHAPTSHRARLTAARGLGLAIVRQGSRPWAGKSGSRARKASAAPSSFTLSASPEPAGEPRPGPSSLGTSIPFPDIPTGIRRNATGIERIVRRARLTSARCRILLLPVLSPGPRHHTPPGYPVALSRKIPGPAHTPSAG